MWMIWKTKPVDSCPCPFQTSVPTVSVSPLELITPEMSYKKSSSYQITIYSIVNRAFIAQLINRDGQKFISRPRVGYKSIITECEECKFYYIITTMCEFILLFFFTHAFVLFFRSPSPRVTFKVVVFHFYSVDRLKEWISLSFDLQ